MSEGIFIIECSMGVVDLCYFVRYYLVLSLEIAKKWSKRHQTFSNGNERYEKRKESFEERKREKDMWEREREKKTSKTKQINK